MPLIDCPHAEIAGRRITCKLGKFGGRPHVGVCRACLAGTARASKLKPVSAWLTARRAICTPSCPDDCPMHHQSGCRRMAMLSREAFHCPTGRF